MRKIRIAGILFFVCMLAAYMIYEFKFNVQRDTDGPKIVMNEDTLSLSAMDEEDMILSDIIVSDKKDGDLTDRLVVEKISNFIGANRRQATIAVSDSDNNVTKIIRELAYTDYFKPRFEIASPLRFSITENELLKDITAMDVIDGDITDKIKLIGQYNMYTGVTGDFEATLQVSNSAGDVSSVPVTISMYDPTERITTQGVVPEITLSTYLVNIELGKSFSPWDYITQLKIEHRQYIRKEDNLLHWLHPNVDNQLKNSEIQEIYGEENLSIDNPVDTNILGTYEVNYSVVDADENTGTARLVVVVSE